MGEVGCNAETASHAAKRMLDLGLMVINNVLCVYRYAWLLRRVSFGTGIAGMPAQTDDYARVRGNKP